MAWTQARQTGKNMRRLPPVRVLEATLGLAECDDGTDLWRAGVGGLAGCFAGDALLDGGRLKGAAVGAVAGELADYVRSDRRMRVRIEATRARVAQAPCRGSLLV